jgi:hypothetical protein
MPSGAFIDQDSKLEMVSLESYNLVVCWDTYVGYCDIFLQQKSAPNP